MIRTFRPWQIFEHLSEDNKVKMVIPTVPGTESLTVFALETQLLIAAARIVRAKNILEIGTCMGYTALHLAMNTEAMITAVDIEKRTQVWEGTDYEDRIDYRILPTKLHHPKTYDMVFIDGDHSYEGVKKDTQRALKTDPKVIVWHDYENPFEIGVKKYILGEFARTHNLIHVADSWLCFWFREDL